MKLLGIALIVFGLIDLIGSWTGLDVWSDWLGVELNGFLYMISAWVELGVGYFLFNLGDGGDEDSQAPDPE